MYVSDKKKNILSSDHCENYNVSTSKTSLFKGKKLVKLKVPVQKL